MRPRPYARIVAAAAIAVVGCGSGGPSASTCRSDFDRPAWLAPESSTKTPTVRQRLADELVDCKALIGLSRADVRALLGPPDHGRTSSPFWEYVTGPQRVMPIDNELLGIVFTKGVVTEVRFTND